jgi:hypothetical protein
VAGDLRADRVQGRRGDREPEPGAGVAAEQARRDLGVDDQLPVGEERFDAPRDARLGIARGGGQRGVGGTAVVRQRGEQRPVLRGGPRPVAGAAPATLRERRDLGVAERVAEASPLGLRAVREGVQHRARGDVEDLAGLGEAFGAVNTARQLGLAIGIAVLGSTYQGRIAADGAAGGLGTTFTVAGAAGIVGGMLALALLRRPATAAASQLATT